MWHGWVLHDRFRVALDGALIISRRKQFVPLIFELFVVVVFRHDVTPLAPIRDWKTGKICREFFDFFASLFVCFVTFSEAEKRVTLSSREAQL